MTTESTQFDNHDSLLDVFTVFRLIFFYTNVLDIRGPLSDRRRSSLYFIIRTRSMNFAIWIQTNVVIILLSCQRRAKTQDYNCQIY